MGKTHPVMTRTSVSEHWERCVPMWSLCEECAAVHLHSNRRKSEMENLLKKTPNSSRHVQP